MAQLEFVELAEGNIQDAISVCNMSLDYDVLCPSTLRRITFRDPNFESHLALIAYGDQKPLGFVVGCRRIKEPAEYVDPRSGWIKVIAAAHGSGRGEVEVLNLMCEFVETELKNLGAEVVRLTDFASWHIWAGIDLRYESILEVLENRGYSKVGEAVDYVIGLRGFYVPSRILKLRDELHRHGIAITLAARADGGDLCDWVKAKFGAGWAYEVATSIENAGNNGSGTLVAKDRGGDIVGFSTHGGLEPNWFGPIGVDESRRKSGVGSALLFESLRLMRLNGIAEAIIPWTGQLFFYTQVPGIVGIRHYHIMSKNL